MTIPVIFFLDFVVFTQRHCCRYLLVQYYMLRRLIPISPTALHDFQRALRMELYLKETFVTVVEQFRTFYQASEAISMAQLFSEWDIIYNPYIIGT